MDSKTTDMKAVCDVLRATCTEPMRQVLDKIEKQGISEQSEDVMTGHLMVLYQLLLLLPGIALIEPALQARIVAAMLDVIAWALDRQHALRLLADPTIIYTNYKDPEQPLAKIEHWAVKLLASSLIESLERTKAQNFVMLDVGCQGHEVTVTIQRKGKKSPTQRIKELEERIEQLEETLAANRAEREEGQP